MGTSVSQMSPRTRGWNIVQTVYTTESIGVERAVTEIWRAATGEATNLATQLASPIVARIEQIASTSGSPTEIAMRVEMEIASSGSANFACEVARLAAIKTAQAPVESRQTLFREKLFAEASSYFVSRDISGFVGQNFRNQNVSEMVEFKQKAMESTTVSVRKSSEQLKKASWSEYVAGIVDDLRGKSKK
ncbi:hypothetical protein KF728_09140 [Candidatus Obscuribacterales bacterium]|nr:hypothetical protein [Candidatus Obscuribacterales bacterium]